MLKVRIVSLGQHTINNRRNAQIVIFSIIYFYKIPGSLTALNCGNQRCKDPVIRIS